MTSYFTTIQSDRWPLFNEWNTKHLSSVSFWSGSCTCGCVIFVSLQKCGICVWPVFRGRLTGLQWLWQRCISVSGQERRIDIQGKERNKGNVGGVRSDEQIMWAPTLERPRERHTHTHPKLEEDRRAVCLCWIISVGQRLRVPAVSSGLIHGDVCQPQPALSFSSWGLQTLALKEGNSSVTTCDSACIKLVAPHRGWQTRGGALSLHQQGETDTQQHQSSGWDLAAIVMLDPFCFLCSSNPPLRPSAWQSCAHRSLALTIRAHKHKYAHQRLVVARLSPAEWKKAITADVTSAQHIRMLPQSLLWLRNKHNPAAPLLLQTWRWCQLKVWPQLSLITLLHHAPFSHTDTRAAQKDVGMSCAETATVHHGVITVETCWQSQV